MPHDRKLTKPTTVASSGKGAEAADEESPVRNILLLSFKKKISSKHGTIFNEFQRVNPECLGHVLYTFCTKEEERRNI